MFCNLCIQSLQYTSAAFKHKKVQNKTHFHIAVIVITTSVLLLDIVFIIFKDISFFCTAIDAQ